MNTFDTYKKECEKKTTDCWNALAQEVKTSSSASDFECKTLSTFLSIGTVALGVFFLVESFKNSTSKKPIKRWKVRRDALYQSDYVTPQFNTRMLDEITLIFAEAMHDEIKDKLKIK